MATDMVEVLNWLDRMAIDKVNLGMRQNQLKSVHERSFRELKESVDEGRQLDKAKSTVMMGDTGQSLYSTTAGPQQLSGIVNLSSNPQNSSSTTSTPSRSYSSQNYGNLKPVSTPILRALIPPISIPFFTSHVSSMPISTSQLPAIPNLNPLHQMQIPPNYNQTYIPNFQIPYSSVIGQIPFPCSSFAPYSLFSTKYSLPQYPFQDQQLPTLHVPQPVHPHNGPSH